MDFNFDSILLSGSVSDAASFLFWLINSKISAAERKCYLQCYHSAVSNSCECTAAT